MEDNKPPPKAKLLRIEIRVAAHKASRFAHKVEHIGHVAYFGFLGFGFHAAYQLVALGMFFIVIIAMLPQGTPDA